MGDSDSKTVLVPGSFDPVTLGHLAMIRFAAGAYDKVVVGVLQNADKTCLFSPRERVAMIEASVRDAGLSNVSVVSYEGMTADLYRAVGAIAMIRGVRDEKDEAYEQTILDYHARHDPDLTTVFWHCPPELAHCSSTAVRQALAAGREVSDLVSPAVADYLKNNR